MERRSEQEMFSLILDTARRDDRIRAVWLNGSRANPGAPRDPWQDFDVVYLVNRVEDFLAEPDWIDCFGPRLIMQTRHQQTTEENPDFSDWYIYLMQFADGNRIDLSLVPVERAAEHFAGDRMQIVLLDKDGRLPRLPSTDSDYLPKPPGRREFENCCNEFWWVSTYVVKGIWRQELPYAQGVYNHYVRDAFDQMARWKIGEDTGFAANPGKMGKYFERFLSRTDWEQLKATYADGDYEHLRSSLLTLGTLFGKWGRELAGRYGYTYPEAEEAGVMAFIRSNGGGGVPGQLIGRLPLEGLQNTRDLGGLVMQDGRRIRWNRLIRSGELYGLTDADVEQLRLHQLRLVVDFRTPLERTQRPDPEIPGAANVHLPVLDEETVGVTREQQGADGLIRLLLRLTAQPGGAEQYMAGVYGGAVTNAHALDMYRQFFELLLNQQEGAVLWHCSAGKDRAGMAAAMVLYALGASDELVMEDYLRVNDFTHTAIEGLAAQILAHSGNEAAAEMSRELTGARPAYLQSALNKVKECYGSMDAFLEQAIGLTPEKRERLKQMYLID